VNRQVIWEAQAIDQAAGFLRDDPDGVREMLDAVAWLADEPALPGHSHMGHLTDGGRASAATG
jgi:mRNA interferase RelE/StbE